MYWGLTISGAAIALFFAVAVMTAVPLARPHEVTAAIPTLAYYLFLYFYGYISFHVGLFHVRNGRGATPARWHYRFVAIFSGFLICIGAIELALDSALRNEIRNGSVADLLALLVFVPCCFGLFVGLRHFRR